MSLSDFVVFRTYLKPIEADLAKIVLDVAGIESFIRNDGTRPNLWMGAIELLVHTDDLGRADEILGNEETNPNGSTIWEAPPHHD
jgi:hypothetical protein